MASITVRPIGFKELGLDLVAVGVARSVKEYWLTKESARSFDSIKAAKLKAVVTLRM